VHANGLDDALPRVETLVLMAGVGLSLEAVRAQLASAVDGIAFVTRRGGGERRVDAIGEVVVGVDGRPELRPLFTRAGGTLEAVAAPTRAPRRPDPPGAWWSQC
jgi:Flp pilus assembly CpaF family ATPase